MIDIIKHQFLLRVFEEGVTRINHILDIIDEDQVWYAPNDQMNSVGNLILHLNGNVTQWIVSGIGNLPDQ